MSFIYLDKRFKMSKILIDNYIFMLLMLVLVTHKGTNGFGYDSAASCSPNGKLSRRGRAQMLAAIPCDLSRQPYCNLPGAGYPWQAVRRFVHENQGLMKRMYGDVRHISVLRDEILNNDIETEDIETTAARYSRVDRSAKFMQQRSEDFGGTDNINNGLKHNDIILQPHFRPVTVTSTSTPATTTSGETTKPGNTKLSSQKENVTESLNELITEKTVQNNDKQFSNITSQMELFQDALLRKSQKDKSNDDRNLASNSVYELPTLTSNELIPPTTNGDNIEIIASPQLDNIFKNLTNDAQMISATLKANKIRASTTVAVTNNSTTNKAEAITTKTIPTSKSTITRTTTTPTETTNSSTVDFHVQRRKPQYPNRQRLRPHHQQQHQNHRFNPIPTNGTQILKKSEYPPSSPSPSSTTTQSGLSVKNSTTALKVDNNEMKLVEQQERPSTQATLITTATPTTTTTTTSTSETSSLKQKYENFSNEKIRRQPTVPSNKFSPLVSSVAPNVAATKAPVLRDGQLFQDTVKQEPIPTVNMRGVNACPVKEEVVAPFWANNTRGEILALLNLYPFEQYVHWEKCTHENKQMYCRDGCRCEQQYRLHRLLAYDPRNECRGIFSDWFRFPSCCICKCYNVPMEFRATSRSPRMQSFPEDHENNDEDNRDRLHPLDVAEKDVKRAIYEHATEDWYRPRDEYYEDEYWEE